MLFSLRKRIVANGVDFAPKLISLLHKERQWDYTLEDYRQMPPQSLGAEVANYLDERNFDFIYNSHHHDIRHILLDYGMDTEGEIRMQAFMVGNNWKWNYKGWLALIFGMIFLPELWTTLLKDWKRGQSAKRISKINWQCFLTDDLEALKERFGIRSRFVISLK
jgi:ubiquinone biosynthesis protein Coq4